MPILDDGTVLPSRFTLGDASSFDSEAQFENFGLRIGEVIECIPSDDPRSYSRRFREYSVKVQHHGRGTLSTRIYNGCTLLSQFGGIADVENYTLRVGDVKLNKGIGKGSKVLILCINGESNNPIIIGGLRDSQDTPDPSEDSSVHHYSWSFNGINFQVNNSGELSISFKGSTEWDGKLSDTADADASGSTLKFSQDGSINLQDAKGQTIKIDRPNGQITIQGDQKVSVSADSDIDLNSGGTVNITGSTAININASTGVSMAGGSSSGIKIGSGSDAMLKGSAYRNSERSMHQAMSNALSSMASALMAASISLTNGDLAGAASAASSMADAISNFESKSEHYLSKLNKAD